MGEFLVPFLYSYMYLKNLVIKVKTIKDHGYELGRPQSHNVEYESWGISFPLVYIYIF